MQLSLDKRAGCTIRLATALLLGAAMAGLATGQKAAHAKGQPADATTAKSLAADAVRRMEAADFRVTGRLVEASGGGSRKSYNLTVKAHRFPDGLRILCEITAPAEARQRILIKMTPTGQRIIEISKPGEKAPHALPFEKWGDGIQGTAFSYEDLAESQFLWAQQALLPDAKYGARDCRVLKSEPGAADRSHYSAVSTWIDKLTGAPVFVQKTLQDGGKIKEFISYGLRQTGGFWSASQIEAKVQGSGGSSLLIFERGTANAKLTRGDFDAAGAGKP